MIFRLTSSRCEYMQQENVITVGTPKLQNTCILSQTSYKTLELAKDFLFFLGSLPWPISVGVRQSSYIYFFSYQFVYVIVKWLKGVCIYKCSQSKWSKVSKNLVLVAAEIQGEKGQEHTIFITMFHGSINCCCFVQDLILTRKGLRVAPCLP